MVSANHPLLGIRARNGGDYVVDRLGVPIGRDFEVNAGRAGADVVGHRQAAAPAFGCDLALQRRKEGLRVGVGNRQHRNLGDGLSVFDRKSFCSRNGADAWGQGVAGIIGIHDAAALYTLAWAPATIGIVVAVKIAVFAGIGVDDAAQWLHVRPRPWALLRASPSRSERSRLHL